MRGRPTLLIAAVVAAAMAGCSGVPSDRYGIDEVRIEGDETMDSEALRACLASQERPPVTLWMGSLGAPSCGSPPFDGSSPSVALWTWPWTEWPLFDELVFERDLDRVVRWYHARGHFDARVVETRIEPEPAASSDTVLESTDCERRRSDQGCVVRITIVVEEGPPTHVTEVALLGMETLDGELVEELEGAVLLAEGDRFDEALHEQTKRKLLDLLVERSYARATVRGEVRVDRDQRIAGVEYRLDPGPPCVFGDVFVEGNDDLPGRPIREAARISGGDPYSTSGLREVQHAVYDLGAFASVDVRPIIPDEGSRIDLTISVVPARRTRFQVGAGVQAGVLTRRPTNEAEQIPQWDLHLLGLWEHRNLFGGLRRLIIEERPRLIFNEQFPRVTSPELGNTFHIGFGQPGFIEPRTRLLIDAVWELGPDPYLDVFRHELLASIAVERYFLDRRLLLSLGITESLYLVPEPTPVSSSSDLMYLEQLAVLDLRNDSVRVSRGLFLSLSMQEAGYFLPSSWDYFRLAPELRGYLPLPLGMVLATRFSLGALFIRDADPGLDIQSRNLGPTQVRFRGGGTTSNRGFGPGELGDGPDGGTRRWLAATELRFPVTADFWLTPFADMGDVSQEPTFRWNHLQLAVGLGFRLVTFIGVIRLDFGWRVPGAQVVNGEDERFPGGKQGNVDLLLFEFPGAINLTLGDSF